jgi:RimJ/RimL family protein N-acetyltransferase
MQVLLETKRLVLRKFTEADAESLYELDNDPDVMRYLNGGVPASREVIQNDILPLFLDYDANNPGLGFWAAIEKSSEDFLGWFSFRPSSENLKDVSIGYRLKKSSWGKGYATEGSRALIDQGFEAWGIQRVAAITYGENIGSRRVMEKVGMTLVRTFRMTPEEIASNGTFHTDDATIWDGDDVEYALEKEDWERQKLSEE